MIYEEQCSCGARIRLEGMTATQISNRLAAWRTGHNHDMTMNSVQNMYIDGGTA